MVAEPLPMLAVLAMQAGVTIGSVVLAGAEISHRYASIVDPLTGLLNRQGLPDRFEELRLQALATAAPISVGDRVLREVVEPADGAAITASFGVSGAAGEEIDFDRLYRRADQALYEAKRGGRDRVTVSATATPA